MKRSRLSLAAWLASGGSILAAAIAAAPAPAPTPAAWAEFSLPESRLSVRLPAAPQPDAKKSGRFSVDTGDASWMVEDDVLDPAVHAAVARGDRELVRRVLDTMRDEMIRATKGTLAGSDSADFAGSPSVRFGFRTEIEGRPFEGWQRVVLTAERIYTAIAIAPAGTLKKADVETFLGSLRIRPAAASAKAPLSAAPPPPFRVVSYHEAVCRRMPALPVTFSLPADYESRPVGKTVEGGCLWGAKDDLDRVTANPEEGDFSNLRRGVFRARVSTNVVCSPETGVFDSMDGTGEDGIREQLRGTAATIVTWKKETLAGLPALQIVADLPGAGRVYMLYLGNTRVSSNVVLVNYYQPKNRTATDDETWARFVAGVHPSK